MTTPEPMLKLFAAIDKNKEKFIDNLSKAVAIKSVSAWPHTRPEITMMMKVSWKVVTLRDVSELILTVSSCSGWERS